MNFRSTRARVTAPIAAALTLLVIGGPVAAQTASDAAVPFIGCAADGQMGPLAPPATGAAPAVPSPARDQLAYYAAKHLAVLAPRGWHCFELYGSNGATLIVTPEPHNAKDLLRPDSSLQGPAVQLSLSDGETNGRFAVAKVAARIFPVAQGFVDQVIAEGILPKSEFPAGPYPDDKLTRKSARVVEFTTPGKRDGLGTASRLAKNADPIDGVAILSPENNLLQLSVRLPTAQRELAATIIEATEADRGRRQAQLAPIFVSGTDQLGTVRQFLARCDRGARDFDWCEANIISIGALYADKLCSDLLAVTGSAEADNQKADAIAHKVVALLRSNPDYLDDDAQQTVLIALMALSGCH